MLFDVNLVWEPKNTLEMVFEPERQSCLFEKFWQKKQQISASQFLIADKTWTHYEGNERNIELFIVICANELMKTCSLWMHFRRLRIL